MATKTSFLGLTKPAYTDAADIQVLNDNLDIIEKALGARTRVFNLLDNSDFRNPVNQRGASAYGGTGYMYSIDRWILPNAKISVSVGSDGIAVTNNDSDPRTIMQRTTALNGYDGPVTFAVCLADGTILCGTCVVNSSAAVERQHLWAVGDKNVGAALYDDGSGYKGVGIIVKANTTVNLRWAALYEGAYDAETLPAYVHKGYAAELAECQRYYVRFTTDVDAMFLPGGSNHNTFYGTLHLPVPMRIDSPTVKFENVNLYAYTAGSAITINQLTAPSNSATHGFVALRVAHDTDAIAAGAPGCIRILAGGYIELSADL